jgi:hypothetical protein
VVGHAFAVRPGSRNLSSDQWRTVRAELEAWFPECLVEIDVGGEMGPFGVRIASRITLTIERGPERREAAREVFARALAGVGRPDLLAEETERA